MTDISGLVKMVDFLIYFYNAAIFLEFLVD